MTEILDAFARRGQAGYHACGTCRMGTDSKAVLEHVCGFVEPRACGSWTVVISDVGSGNTNGPMMAVAARAADLILEDAR